MQYSQVTLAVAWENLSGVSEKTALDAVLDAVDHYTEGEVTVLEFDERPMVLLVDYSAEKADS